MKISIAEQAGIPVRTIQAWLGHSTLDDRMREKLNRAADGD